MRFSEAWLREHANPDINTDQLVHQLTMAGLEVDGVEPAAPDFSNVVVGKVTEIQPHPNADRLKVCSVETGSGDPLQIVCGAANVHEDMRVPVALIDAVLPGDFKIRRSKLRGVESSGMLCSEAELGLAETADGLMALPADARPGQNIREYLQLDDQIIEVDLTPNRADCLSIEGVAREVAVQNRLTVNNRSCTATEISSKRKFGVRVEAAEACPRYLGRVIENVDSSAVTPLWMQERLRRAGLRSLGPLVDVTNYVMLEVGQPLHAFDLDRLETEIVVRFAAEGESLELLNGEHVDLIADSLIIADAAKPLALAGIMGGQQSAVGDQTVNIFLECAFFTPAVIMGKARNYGLHTDSSHRFERGVDPELQTRAIERATLLITEICGGKPGPVVDRTATEFIPRPACIRLRPQRVKKILGIEAAPAEIEDILQRLGMTLETDGDIWIVTPPSNRFDIAIEADLIEEIGRTLGYDNLPLNSPVIHAELDQVSETEIELDRVKDLLAARGYQEAITYSFVDEELQNLIAPGKQPIRLSNPISSELSVMRASLWSGLLTAAQKNIHRQHTRIRLFESGLRFEASADGINQTKTVAGLITGTVLDENWAQQPARPADFFDIKSDVEALLNASGDTFGFAAAEHPALHPGQSAQIRTSSGQIAGWVGMLHPLLEKKLDFDQQVFLFELDQQFVLRKSMPGFRKLSRFPSVRRDLALIVGQSLPASEIVDFIRDSGDQVIQEVKVFDVYQGQGVESGRKSVALGLILQDSSGTLQESEIDAIVSGILDRLNDKYDAKLRE